MVRLSELKKNGSNSRSALSQQAAPPMFALAAVIGLRKSPLSHPKFSDLHAKRILGGSIWVNRPARLFNGLLARLIWLSLEDETTQFDFSLPRTIPFVGKTLRWNLRQGP